MSCVVSLSVTAVKKKSGAGDVYGDFFLVLPSLRFPINILPPVGIPPNLEKNKINSNL